MARNILYKPNLKYHKNFFTTGEFEIDEDIAVGFQTTDAILDKLETILPILPNVIKEVYLNPYYLLKDEYSKLVPPTIEIVENDNYVPATNDMFAKGPDIYIDIKDPLAEKNEIIGLRYYLDFLDVYQDYLNELNKIAENFIYTTLSTMSLGNISSNIRDYTKINNVDLKHVSDYLIKSDISLGQSSRLHKKLFDLDATILHIRNIKLSAALIARYSDINKKDNISDIEVTSNILLEESRRIADKKYIASFYNLYKYLHSNVILMSESMAQYTKQNKAMMIINKYEG